MKLKLATEGSKVPCQAPQKMLERTIRQAQATTPDRLETTCYKGSEVSEEGRGNLASRKLEKTLDVAVCEFRLITEPFPGLQDGAAAYVRLSPSGTQGEKVPLRRHPIPCRSPVLATIELNKTRAFACTTTPALKKC